MYKYHSFYYFSSSIKKTIKNNDITLYGWHNELIDKLFKQHKNVLPAILINIWNISSVFAALLCF